MGVQVVLSDEEWLRAVRTRLGTADCEVLQVSAGQLEGDVGGFLGDHLQVKVTALVHTPKASTRHELPFFVKRVPYDLPKHTEFVLSSRAFEKETGLYAELFPRFLRSQPPWAPQCYLTRPDMVVLEDLLAQGYRLAGRRNTLDYPHCALLLRALARFHAASLVFEEDESKASGKQYKLNEHYPHLLIENLFTQDFGFHGKYWFSSSVNSLKNAVEFLPKYQKYSECYEEILQHFTDSLSQLFELIKPSNKYRNILCHGDLWTNNIFYRYDKNDDATPVEVRLVDFQIARYTPPAVDVMSFLHLNTTREFRSDNSKKLLCLYHATLGEELSRHGYEVEHIVPWTEFEDSCEMYSRAGRIIAPCYHLINTMPQQVLDDHLTNPERYEEFITGNRDEAVANCFRDDKHYRDRLISELEELIECVVLKKPAPRKGSCTGDSYKELLRVPPVLETEAH